MYPGDWELEDVNEISPDALVSVASTGMLGTYARVVVAKDIDDGSYFAATKSDWKAGIGRAATTTSEISLN